MASQKMDFRGYRIYLRRVGMNGWQADAYPLDDLPSIEGEPERRNLIGRTVTGRGAKALAEREIRVRIDQLTRPRA